MISYTGPAIKWLKDMPRTGVVQRGRYAGCFVTYFVETDKISLQILLDGGWRTLHSINESGMDHEQIAAITEAAETLFATSSVAYRYAVKTS